MSRLAAAPSSASAERQNLLLIHELDVRPAHQVLALEVLARDGLVVRVFDGTQEQTDLQQRTRVVTLAVRGDRAIEALLESLILQFRQRALRRFEGSPQQLQLVSDQIDEALVIAARIAEELVAGAGVNAQADEVVRAAEHLAA